MAINNATQQFVPVKEVRDGVMIMKNGGLRGILMVSSTNFALKSETEQNSIIGAFQTFLNTLDFSVQIVIHSRELDIRPYLELLNQREAAQQSDLMKLQLREYRSFVERFVDQTNIMRKHFYVVVPYTQTGFSAQGNNVVSSFFDRDKKSPSGTTEAFAEKKLQLDQRMNVVNQGLAAAGLRSARLNTEEVLELLYRSFNPGVFETPIQTAP